jgi:hypothetical protein
MLWLDNTFNPNTIQYAGVLRRESLSPHVLNTELIEERYRRKHGSFHIGGYSDHSVAELLRTRLAKR